MITFLSYELNNGSNYSLKIDTQKLLICICILVEKKKLHYKSCIT